MNNEPTSEHGKSIDRERRLRIFNKGRRLLAAQEAESVDTHDVDTKGNPIVGISIEADAPSDSVLHRYGYGRIDVSWFPETDADIPHYHDREALFVTLIGQDKLTRLERFAMFYDSEQDEATIEVSQDQTDPRFDNNTPLAHTADGNELLQLDSALNAIPEVLTFDTPPQD